MRLEADQLSAVMQHAEACAPLEACGVIVADGVFHPVRNLATEHGHFVMDRKGYCRLDCDRKIIAVVHSHVHYPAVASDSDLAMCEKCGVPWIIVSWPGGRWTVIEPSGWAAPLVGREWQWGSHDCFSLIRDALNQYAGIAIHDYERDWLFWRRGEKIIEEQFGDAGFVMLPPGTQPKQCDLFAMSIGSDVVNHLALFLEPDRILHQLYRQLSVRELYGGQWRDRTRLHLRHERLM